MRQQGRVPVLTLASALFSFSMMTIPPNAARADTWGCEVLLCMSNPAGPEAVPQCVPPMQKLYDALKHGLSHLMCPESGWSGNIGYRPYNCPTGEALMDLKGRKLCRSPTGSMQPAEARMQPYYADIPNTNGQPGTQRIWLSEH